MDKFALLETIIAHIAESLAGALQAADEAHATATHKENVAENKYDTLGLEAAYLAHGQSERVLQLQEGLKSFEELAQRVAVHDAIELGSLVHLASRQGDTRFMFIGPASGGLVVQFSGEEVTVITPDSPLGAALLGAEIGDEILLVKDHPGQIVEAVW